MGESGSLNVSDRVQSGIARLSHTCKTGQVCFRGKGALYYVE